LLVWDRGAVVGLDVQLLRGAVGGGEGYGSGLAVLGCLVGVSFSHGR
jgi:hypothetical protein